jgi:hypothetical protein
VRAFEHLVRECPAQWLMFDDVWREPPVQTVGARASRPELGRRSALAGILRSNARAMLRRPS